MSAVGATLTLKSCSRGGNDIPVVAEVGVASVTYQPCKTASLNVVVMAISMPGYGDIERVKQLWKWDPKACQGLGTETRG